MRESTWVPQHTTRGGGSSPLRSEGVRASGSYLSRSAGEGPVEADALNRCRMERNPPNPANALPTNRYIRIYIAVSVGLLLLPGILFATWYFGRSLLPTVFPPTAGWMRSPRVIV